MEFETKDGWVTKSLEIALPNEKVTSRVSCKEEIYNEDVKNEMESRLIAELSIKALFLLYSKIYKDGSDIRRAYELFKQYLNAPPETEWKSNNEVKI